jgi:hypothetical protein
LQSKYQTTTDCWISDFYCKFTIRRSNFTHCFPFFSTSMLQSNHGFTVSIRMLLCPPAWTILSSRLPQLRKGSLIALPSDLGECGRENYIRLLGTCLLVFPALLVSHNTAH